MGKILVYTSYTRDMNSSFQQCISEICGLEISSLASQGKYAVYANSVAVVEGHKGIAEYGKQKISFVFGKSTLEILGADLKIKCLQGNYAVVAGQISSVAVQNV